MPQPADSVQPVTVVTVEIRFTGGGDAEAHPQNALLPDWCRVHDCVFREWDGTRAKIQMEESAFISKSMILKRKFPGINEIVVQESFAVLKVRNGKGHPVYLEIEDRRGKPWKDPAP